MKKTIFLFTTIFIGIIGKSNPYIPPPIISEIYFSGSNIQIEFYFDGSWWFDSFDGLNLVSSTDTIEFIDGINIYPDEIIVLNQDDLAGSFQFNTAGDHIYVIDDDGFAVSYIEYSVLKFGNYPDANIPAPDENQSIAFQSFFDPWQSEYYYNIGIEQPPTIGSDPFSISARGIIEGYIYDLDNNPVPDIFIYYPYFDPTINWDVRTDSTGYFSMPNLLCRNYNSIQFSYNTYEDSFSATVYPYETTSVEIQLDTTFVSIPKYYNYPNPFTGLTSFNIKIPNNINYNSAFLAIYDLTGKHIDRIEILSGNSSVEWNGSNYDPGIYIYNLVLDNKQFATHKMIIR